MKNYFDKLKNGIFSDEIIIFLKMLCKIGENSENDQVASAIYEIASSISLQLSEPKRTEALGIIKSTNNGQAAVFAKNVDRNFLIESTSSPNEFNCFDKMLDFERQYNVDIGSHAHK